MHLRPDLIPPTSMEINSGEEPADGGDGAAASLDISLGF
ncbi:hypothetical protein CRUP_002249 [Coryphaenoides rupestris]|nr:hypothetical protein CRUP_002249 [Coryphaenoides rupestris]